MNTIKLVKTFQVAFQQPMSDGIPSMSRGERNAVQNVAGRMAELGRELRLLAQAYDMSVVLLRLQLMQEELAEVAAAFAAEDKVQLLGELCDMRYVVDGTVLTVGMEEVFHPAFCDVHEANMSKLEDGVPVIGPEGRVVKGRYYKKHDLRPYIEHQIATPYPEESIVEIAEANGLSVSATLQILQAKRDAA